MTANDNDLMKMTPTKKPPRTARPDGKTADEAGKDTVTAKDGKAIKAADFLAVATNPGHKCWQRNSTNYYDASDKY